ncbi:MAG TPA: glycosyltransferase family 4 protein, partial [Fimbriimonadaceae bacterium]|nr:glycosyltransferase family 4 protein [Fimbriimonadaceae bacterium]
MSLILAEHFMRAGHEVKVVTQTLDDSKAPYPYPVLRQPDRKSLIEAVRWSEVVFHNNISLQTAWPLAFVRRPWVIVHQTWIRQVDGSIARQDKIKRFLLRFAHQIAISQAIADDVKGCRVLIGNCYNSSLFRKLPDVTRDRDLVFVGRLVSDKGVDLAIGAVAELRERGIETNLTIIGGGEEREALERQAAELGIQDRVRFTGPMQGEPLVAEINRHRIMVVPSRWKEPFGIVALEGIACGCAVVGSEGG